MDRGGLGREWEWEYKLEQDQEAPEGQGSRQGQGSLKRVEAVLVGAGDGFRNWSPQGKMAFVSMVQSVCADFYAGSSLMKNTLTFLFVAHTPAPREEDTSTYETAAKLQVHFLVLWCICPLPPFEKESSWFSIHASVCLSLFGGWPLSL